MRHILHADFDAFYTSVEQRDNPALRGKPVVVGGSPDTRGVVASASYEARAFGVRSAMPMRTALGRCPSAIRVPPRFDRYREVSRHMMDIFLEIAPLVEALSLDEAYLDVTEAVTRDRRPEDIASDLRDRVKLGTGLTISVGVATSKSVAKIASAMDKPDGLTVVSPGSERRFLAPLPVDRLSGVGPKTAARLAGESIRTIGEMTERADDWWIATFGRTGPGLKRLALGTDDRPVVPHRDRKSVSAETTLARDTGDTDVLLDLGDRMSSVVGRHLADSGLRARTVKIKLRLADFATFTRQITSAEPVATPEAVAAVAASLLQRELRPDRLFRLVGVGVSGLEAEEREALQPRLIGFQ